MTYTFATLKVSRGAWEHIAGLIRDADNGWRIHDGERIDMTGIELVRDKPEEPEAVDKS